MGQVFVIFFILLAAIYFTLDVYIIFLKPIIDIPVYGINFLLTKTYYIYSKTIIH